MRLPQVCIYLGMENNRYLSDKESEKIYKGLSKIIYKHVLTIELCKEMVDIFAGIILMHFISSAVIICIIAVNITVVSY